MKTFRALAICLTAFAVSSASISSQTLEVPDAVIPVVGSTAGGSGANFRTEAQLHNPGASTIRGKLVFVYQGIPIQPNPPAELEYELTPKETIVYEDLVAAMGGNGLGSIDIFAEVGGVPDMVVRAFDDKGPDGTTGLTVPVLDADLALTAGRSALLVVPSDLVRYRFNIGVRTIPSEQQQGLAQVRVFDGNGNQIGGTIEKSFQEIFFAQAAAEDFLGMTLAAGSSVLIEVVEGRMFFYSTTTDNTTNDGSIQIDKLFNLAPVLDDLDIHVMTPAATPVTVPLAPTDPDDDPITSSLGVGPTNGVVEITNGEDGIVEVTYTPEGGFEGDDVFTVIFDDGNGGKTTVTITVTVGGGNSSPTALGNSYSVIEGSTLTVPAPGVLGNDQDPDSDPLTAVLETPPSESSAFSLNADGSFTYTPRGGFVGSDTFTYRANDGQASSNLATVRINVTSSNTPPSAVSDSTSTDEDTPIMVTVLANDTDAETPGSLAIISVNTTGTLGTAMVSGSQISYDPTTSPTLQALAAGSSTTDTFQYTIQDPGGLTSTASVTITVNGIDDLPTAVDDSATILEDAAATSIDVVANDVDPDGNTTINLVTQGTSGTVVITGGGTGLTYQPNGDYCGGDSFTYTLIGGSVGTVNVTVTCVNDAPSFTKGAHETVNEDAGAQTVSGWATAISAGPVNEAAQTLSFSVTNNTNPGLFAVPPAIAPSGDLTYTVAPDANSGCPIAPCDGTAMITIVVRDSGGTANGGIDVSGSQSFSITVQSVNDVPSFTKGADQTVLEDSGAQTVNGWATVLSTGPANESGQTLTFNVTNNTNAALFSAGPAISSTGALTYTPAANANGSATITIEVMDDGGTANGGVDTSATQSFAINVTAVNDVPSFTKGANQSVNDNAGAVTVDPWATGVSAGPADESSQTLTFNVTGNTNPSIFSVAPAVSSTGVLTFTPATVVGTVSSTITITLSDNGGTTPGVDTSAPQSFSIQISHANTPPAVIASPKETFDTIGNTSFEFKATQALSPSVFVSGNLVSNFTDSDGPSALSMSGIVGCADITSPYDNCATTNGGVVSATSAGEFTFTPKEGDTNASDTFQYTVTDGETPVTRTVTINRLGRVWYVKNDATAGGLGRSSDPFDTLAEAATASIAGDTIYVYFGDGATTGQNAGITLKASQRLLGSGVALTVPVAVNGGSSPTTLLAAGTRPLIEHTAGDGVTATDVTGVEIQGLDIKGTSNAIDVSTTAANNGGATISNNVISGAGNEGLDVNADGSGTMALVVTNNTWSATGNAVDIRRSAGMMTLDFSTNTNIVSSGGGGVFIDGGALASSTITGFSNNTVSGNTVGNGISVSNVTFNTVSGGTTTIGSLADPVGASGINLTTVSGSLTFSDLSAYAANGSGVAVVGFSPMTFGVSNTGNVSVAQSTNGPAVDLSTLTSAVTFQTVTSTTSAGRGVNLDQLSGTFTVTGTTTISTPTSFGIRINNSTGTHTFGVVGVTNRGSAGINIAGGSATIGFGATTVGAAGAATTSAVTIDNTTGGSVTFSSLSVNNNGGSGSALAASGNAGAITVTAGSLQGSSGATVSVSSGSGAVSIGATVTNTSGRAVQILNNSGGTKTFSGAITDTNGEGVVANSNTGATMTFSGGLTLSTAANAAFTATGGGTVNVTGTNTLTTTTGTALNVANTTIGSSGLTFRSISSNGAVNGIVLTSTGSSGGLTVTGTGAAGTGGTIQNTTGDAISINNAQDVVLSSITISSPAGDGFDAVNLRGTNRINANSVIEGVNSVVGASGVRVQNTNTNLTLIELDSSTFRNSTSAQAFALFELSGTSNMGVTVKNSTFTNLYAQAVLAAAGQSGGSSGTMTTTVSGNMFVDANTSAGFGENNLGVVVANGATQSATISGNTFDNITKDGLFANTSVLRTQNIGGTWTGTVSGNTIRNINILTGGGRHGIGHVYDPPFGAIGSSTISIINNDIDNLPDREAIFIDYRDFANGGSVTIDNNRIGQRVGSVGAIGGSQEAIELSFRQLTAQNVAVLVEDNIVTATTAFSADQLLDIDAESAVALNTTVRNNTFTQLGAGTELIELSVEDAGTTGCYNVTGNTLSAGGEIDLVHGAGTMNITQASTAAMSAANGGATVGVGGVTANPTFGSAACSTP